ncbi:hypothetical protein GFY24_08020 [Nocardia sp. SYP-A9097]|uniref:hypothetical protein n=1 Tax=Nocardia sp. SYP-A9097 TaxID=2663237 RepID=UPI00129B0C87|nr:hypothetical protein [Nocardia sp. SYP-A9097]MRH87405.1 hypothetical protein [Nocardia sp. SYP-A9097]
MPAPHTGATIDATRHAPQSGGIMTQHRDRQIVNQIDQLVNDQLADGEPRTGYDYGDPDFPRCPHPWCDEEWHGLPITTRMAEMRWRGEVDPGYRYPDDESPVLCPGSDDPGDFTPADRFRALAELRHAVSAARTTRRSRAQPQWWCCFHVADLTINTVVRYSNGRPQRFIEVNGETIELVPDSDGSCMLGRTDRGPDSTARPQWMAIRCQRVPRAGVWVSWRPNPPARQ